MITDVTVDITEFNALMDILRRRSLDLSNEMRKISQIFLSAVHNNFANETSWNKDPKQPFGNTRSKWRNLAPSTKKQRASLGFNPDHPILYRTGSLMRSIKAIYGKLNAGIDIVGTPMPQAMALHYGSTVNNLPSRPYLQFSADDFRKIERILFDMWRIYR